jgi:hypothetical protein
MTTIDIIAVVSACVFFGVLIWGAVCACRDIPLPKMLIPPPMPPVKEPRLSTCEWCGSQVRLDSRKRCSECGAPAKMSMFCIEPDPKLHSLTW